MTKARNLASGAPAPAGVSTTELGYVDGVTSAIQTQINQKPEYVAGKNAIINGDFGVWQRGTSISLTTSTAAYGADRFLAQCNFSAGTSSFSQQTFTAGTAPVAGYEGQFFGRLTCGSTSTYANYSQKVEDVRTLAGQTATLSYWAKASASVTCAPLLLQNFGSGGSGTVNTSGTSVTLTTSWVRYTTTVSIPSISGKTIGASSFLQVYLEFSNNLNSATIDLWGVQVEAGSTATPFQTATGTKQGELAACQRYYFDSRENGTTNQPFNGYSNSTDYLLSNVRYPVTMRTTPSITIGQSSGTNYVRRISTNAQVAITVTSYPGTAPTGFSAVYAAAAPFVAAVGYDFYILASAEL